MNLHELVKQYLSGSLDLQRSIHLALTRGFNRWEWRAELHRQKREIDNRFRAADDIIVNDQFITINQSMP